MRQLGSAACLMPPSSMPQIHHPFIPHTPIAIANTRELQHTREHGRSHVPHQNDPTSSSSKPARTYAGPYSSTRTRSPSASTQLCHIGNATLQQSLHLPLGIHSKLASPHSP